MDGVVLPCPLYLARAGMATLGRGACPQPLRASAGHGAKHYAMPACLFDEAVIDERIHRRCYFRVDGQLIVQRVEFCQGGRHAFFSAASHLDMLILA